MLNSLVCGIVLGFPNQVTYDCTNITSTQLHCNDLFYSVHRESTLLFKTYTILQTTKLISFKFGLYGHVYGGYKMCKFYEISPAVIEI